jgi:hypothetical protein
MKTTVNYEMFKFKDSNRVVNDGLVKRLIKSINEIGYIQSRALLVDENLTIIDGQHRFEACKRLGLPIYYDISDVDFDKAMLALNMNQMIWRLQDYIHSHANKNKECYKFLKDLEDEYHLGTSNNIIIASGGTTTKALSIRDGKEFEINQNYKKVIEFIFQCKDYFHFWKSKTFVIAVTFLFNNASEKDCKKVLSKIHPLQQQASTTNYLLFFENILNRYSKKDENKIILRR